MHRLCRDDFLCLNMMALWRIEHATPSLSWGERDAKTRRRLGACVRVRGAHFEHKF